MNLRFTELETVGGTQKLSPHYCCSAGIVCVSVPREGLAEWGKEGDYIGRNSDFLMLLIKVFCFTTFMC